MARPPRPLLLLLICLLTACTGPAGAPESVGRPGEGEVMAVRLGQRFALPVGATATLAGEDDLAVTFDAVLNDSRCPSQVQCVEAGFAIIQLTVEEGQQTETIELNSAPFFAANSAETPSYSVHLVQLDPYPETPEEPPPAGSYVATLVLHTRS